MPRKKLHRTNKTSLILLLVAWILGNLLFISGCFPGSSLQTTTKSEHPDLQIITSFLPMYIFTLNLVDGVPGISLSNMAAPETGCLHDYRLLPGDLIKLESADLFIINGAGMEGFMTDLAERKMNLKMIEASTGIPLLTDANGTSNPHVWLSIKNAIRQVQNISLGLQAADPEHAAAYRTNEQTYVARLEQLQASYLEKMAPLAGREIITFHEAFPYFAAEYGLKIAAVIEREPGSEPTAAELAATIELVRSKKIKALFAEPQYPVRVAETIALETSATVQTLDPVVTGAAARDTYEKAMTRNLEVLIAALK